MVKRRITAEEYWDTNLYGDVKTFNIVSWTDETFTFQYAEGMTWNDWFNSEYNTVPFFTGDSNKSDDHVTLWTDVDNQIWTESNWGFNICNNELVEDLIVFRWNDKITSRNYYTSIIG